MPHPRTNFTVLPVFSMLAVGSSYHHTAAVAMEGGTHKALPLSGDLKALNGV